MVSWREFDNYTFAQKINMLYKDGSFIMSIRYYGFKLNLYLLGHF